MKHVWAGKYRRIFGILLVLALLVTAVDFSPFAAIAMGDGETESLSGNNLLTAAEASVEISVRVTDEDGAAVANADVSFLSESNEPVKLSHTSDGMYEATVSVTEESTGELTVSLDGYQTETAQFAFSEVQGGRWERGISLKKLRPVTIIAGEGGSVSVMAGTETLTAGSANNTQKISEVTITPEAGFYVDSCKLTPAGGSEEKEFADIDIFTNGNPMAITQPGYPQMEDGVSVHVSFRKTWTADDLKAALEAQNSFLDTGSGTGLAPGSTVTLVSPEDNRGYGISWSISQNDAGVTVDQSGQIHIPLSAAGKTFSLTAAAVLTKGEKTIQTSADFTSLSVGNLTATEKDYALTYDTSGQYITGITLYSDAEGNNFTSYTLEGVTPDGAPQELTGNISGETILDLDGKEYQSGAKLTLSGTDDGQPYSATVTLNHPIDRKGPALEAGTVTFWQVASDSSEKELTDLTDASITTNHGLAVKISDVADGIGSVTSVTLAIQYEGGQEQTVDGVYENESGTGQGQWVFRDFSTDGKDGVQLTLMQLTAWDSAGNSTNYMLGNWTLMVDTVAPQSLRVEPAEDNGAWTKPENGTKTYRIVTLSGDVSSITIKYRNADGTLTDDSVVSGTDIIDSSWCEWVLSTGDAKVLNRDYVITATDSYGNVSAPFTYNARLDNELPTASMRLERYDPDTGTYTEVTDGKTEYISPQDFRLVISGMSDGGAGLGTVTVSCQEDEGAGQAAKTHTWNFQTSSGERFTWDEDQKTLIFDLSAQDGTYHGYAGITVALSDALNNTAYLYTTEGATSNPVIKIDKKAPAKEDIVIQWNGSGQTGTEEYWYSGGQAGFRFTVTAKDDTPLTAEIYQAASADGVSSSTETCGTALEVSPDYGVSFQSWVYNREDGTKAPDQKLYYIVKITDAAGNAAWSDSVEIRIDETDPVMADREGKPSLRYDFANIKTEGKTETVFHGDLDQETMVNGVLLSKTDVTVSIDLEDPAAGAVQGQTASGIREVALSLDYGAGQGGAAETKVYTLTQQTDGSYTCVLSDEGRYELKQIAVTDYAGNVTVYQYQEAGEAADSSLYQGELTVVIDRTVPEASFADRSYNAGGTWREWYSVAANGDTPFAVTASAEDDYGIYAIDWFMADDDGSGSLIYTPVTAEQPGGADSVPGRLTGNESSQTASSCLTYQADQVQRYAVQVTDWAGNVTVYIMDDSSEAILSDRASIVKIDNQKPQIAENSDEKLLLTYDIRNVKTSSGKQTILHDDIGSYLADRSLISAEDILLTVNAEDLPVLYRENGIASGVQDVVLTFADGREAVSLTSDGNGIYTTILTAGENQTETYVLEAITITDYAGNSMVYSYTAGGLGSLTAVIDKEVPAEGVFATVSGRNSVTDGNGNLTAWYSAQNGPKDIQATVQDDYCIYGITWYRVNTDTPVLGQEGAYTQIGQTLNGGQVIREISRAESFTDNQDQLYAVIAADWAGNQALFYRNESGDAGSRVRIDNDMPVNRVWLSWEGDSVYDGNAVDSGTRYEAAQEGYVYNNQWVTLSVYVQDTLGQGLYQNTERSCASGIRKVDVTVNHDGNREPVMEQWNNQEVQVAEINGQEYLEFTFQIRWTNGDLSEFQNTIEEIVIYDNAGNQTPAEGEVLRDEVQYVLDNMAPELTVDYHPGSYVENSLYPNTYFYREDPAVTISFRERYFYEADVDATINLQAPEAPGALNHSQWSGSGTTYTSGVHAPGDGRYRFSIGEFSDRSGNVMTGAEGTEVADGIFTSYYLVMDTTAPVIEITYTHDGQDITGEITEGNFYDGTVVATVRITEANFDPSMVEIDAVGRASGNNEGMAINWDGEWTAEGEDVHVNHVTFEAQGTYQFTCTARDVVGHEAEVPARSHFVVDTTVPEVEIIYDLNDPENERYYNQVRTAAVRVTDRSFDPEEVEFMIETTGPQPVIGEWSHIGGGGCENELTYHVDGCVYEANVIFGEDGDYSLAFQCTDRAGNQSELVTTDPFTVDLTLPEMTVTYDNNDARNGFYYREARVGTITIYEHNFSPADVRITTTAASGGAPAELPAVSGWSSSGDTHTASVYYTYDGEFTFDVSYTDLAGNEAADYEGDQFVVDLTAPVLEITDIEDMSANNDTVAPAVTWSDINLDTDGILLELTGVNRGLTEVETTSTAIDGGMMVQYTDFPRVQELDDLYTLHATVTDLAGNTSEQTVTFSVNRFGSVYIFDEATEQLLSQYYVNEPARLHVTEINVDTLEFREITYSRDGDIVTMEQGEDYAVTESGTEATWKSYTYDIYEDNFTEEGIYAVTIYSEDRATNRSSNTVKEKEIQFVMDTTLPTIVVTGVEDQEQYNSDRRSVTIDAKDNIYLSEVVAYVDNVPVKTFSEEELTAANGVVTLEIGSSNDWQTLTVKAIDAAGNEGYSDTRVFLITRNVLVQWYQNRPLFWGSLAGLAVGAGVIFMIVSKRKKRNDETA